MRKSNNNSDAMASYERLKQLDSATLRQEIRSNSYQGHTAGLGAGRLQANLVILPEAHALDFMRFCQRNPRPCPLVGVSDTGNPMMFTMGADIDIRTDVPAYNIYENGKLSRDATDITQEWRDDFVAFALGCSFTFEHAAEAAGIHFSHIASNTTVPMYRTNIDCVPAGQFNGNMAVSMRAIPEKHVGLVTEISDQYPLAHGAPVHIGDPEAIGISDIHTPQWGDAQAIPDGYVTVFWACGVTPQLALINAKLPIAISHKPGCMLVTDVDERAQNPILANPSSGESS